MWGKNLINMAEKIGIRPASVTVYNGKVLLVRSEYHREEFYLFPGGGLEFGETIEEGVIRETLEETGVKIKIKQLMHVNEYIYRNDFSKRSITPFFLAEVDGESKINPQTNDGNKIKEALWVNIEDLEKIDVRPKIIAESLRLDLQKEFFHIKPYSVDFNDKK